jgi:hypothetical protein
LPLDWFCIDIIHFLTTLYISMFQPCSPATIFWNDLTLWHAEFVVCSVP